MLTCGARFLFVHTQKTVWLTTTSFQRKQKFKVEAIQARPTTTKRTRPFATNDSRAAPHKAFTAKLALQQPKHPLNMTMQKGTITKYKSFQQIDLPDRTWPDNTLQAAPIWTSVDLRDGNQALAIPMNVDEKIEFFELLVATGFKEIEVGFPSASDTEFRFIRRLVEENRIPEDVTVQVLVQAREHLIRRTFESLAGASNAIVHLYNSTSPLQRRVTFNKSKTKSKRSPSRVLFWSKASSRPSPTPTSACNTRLKASQTRRWSMPWKFAKRSWMLGNPQRPTRSS